MEVKVIGQMDNTIDHTFESANRVYDVGGVSPTINTCGGGGLQPKIIDEPKCLNAKGGRNGIDGLQPSLQDRVYSTNAVSVAVTTSFMPSILDYKKCISTKGKENEVASTILAGYERTNMTGFNADNAVVETVRIKQATAQGYIECEVGGVADFSFPDSKTRRGRVQENGRVSPTLMSGEQDICRICAVDEQNINLRYETFGTLTTDGSSPKHNNRVMEIKRVGQISNDGSQYGTVISESGLSSTLSAGTHGYANNCIQQQYRIRKLTPLECWRLMDFTDEDFYKAEEVNSNTQLYKQAGNSIIKNVLVAIFGQMIPGKENIYKEME